MSIKPEVEIWQTFSIQNAKNQRKTSPNRQNFAHCKEIGDGESNDNVRNFTASSYIAVLRMHIKSVAENGCKCD